MKKGKVLVVLFICMFLTFNQSLVFSQTNSSLSSKSINKHTRSIQPVYRALLIGNYDYPGTDNDLQGPPNDINRMYKIFSNANFGLNHTKFSNIQKVTNTTKQQVFDDINSTFSGATVNDVSYFYYSGHGYSDDTTAYLCTVDENQDFISVDELKKELDMIPGKKIVILDSCYSGGFISRSLKTTTAVNNSSFNKKVIEKFSNSGTKFLTTSDYKVLTASSSTQTSVEGYSNADGLVLGEFTKYLTTGCGYNGEYYADLDDNNSVTLDEACQYVKNNVTDQDVQLYPENDTFPFVENGYTGLESVEAPSINPDQGNYNTATVSINCNTDGAVIRYTTDGTDPSDTSTIYTQPFTLTSTTTVKARAFKDGMNESRIESKTFNIYSGYPQSQHDYSENMDETWTYSVPNNPQKILVNFDSLTNVEDDYDYIYVMDSNGNNINGSPFTSSELSNKTLLIPGNTVKIRLTSDDETNDWGFKIDNIEPYTTDVDVSSITLNKSSLTLQQNDQEQLTATVLPNEVIDKNVIWSSSDTNIASVDQNGIVTAKNLGTATIKAITENGSKEADCTVNVGVQAPYITPDEGYYNVLNNITMSCATDGAIIKYTTDGTEPTVNSPTYSKPISITASTVINAKAFKDGAISSPVTTMNYNIYTGYPESSHNYEDDLDKTWTYIYQGDADSLDITFDNSTYVEKKFDYISVMDENGDNVTGSPFTAGDLSGKTIRVSGNTVEIELTTDDLDSYWGFKVTNIKPITTPVTSVALDKTSADLQPGQSLQLNAALMPASATNQKVTWTSSNQNIAAVNQSGYVTAVTPGNAVITVTTNDGNKTAQCAVCVANDISSIPDCIIIGNSAFSSRYLMNSAHYNVIKNAIDTLKAVYSDNYENYIYYKLSSQTKNNILRLKDNTIVLGSEVAASAITFTAADGSTTLYKFH